MGKNIQYMFRMMQDKWRKNQAIKRFSSITSIVEVNELLVLDSKWYTGEDKIKLSLLEFPLHIPMVYNPHMQPVVREVPPKPHDP